MQSPIFVVRTPSGVLARLVEGGSVRLGRSSSGNDVIVDDPTVSRFHARLRWPRGQRACVDDLGSANGTFVDDEPVHRSAALEEVTHLRLGDHELLVELQHPSLIPDAGHLVCRLYTDLHRSEQAGELTRTRGLADLLLDLERGRRTGTLLLEQGGARAHVLLAGGRVVEAVDGRARGVAALVSMLDRFARARFRLVPDVEPCEGGHWISVRELLAARAHPTERWPAAAQVPLEAAPPDVPAPIIEPSRLSRSS